MRILEQYAVEQKLICLLAAYCVSSMRTLDK